MILTRRHDLISLPHARVVQDGQKVEPIPRGQDTCLLSSRTILACAYMGDLRSSTTFYDNPKGERFDARGIRAEDRRYPQFRICARFCRWLDAWPMDRCDPLGTEGRQSEKYAALGDKAIRMRASYSNGIG